MDGDSIGLLCLVIVLLIIGSAFFSASEVAYASVNKIRIKSKAENDDVQAKKVIYILDNFEKALVTILIGNNIMNIACASLTAFLITRALGLEYVAIATVLITIFIIFIGEMFPKTLAKNYNEAFSLKTAGFMIFLMKILTPLSFLFEQIGRLVTKLINVKKNPTVTEDELVDIIKTIKDEGTMDEDQSELLKSAVEFNVTRVKDVYTPLDKVTSLNTGMSDDTILRIIQSEKYSRYPVYDQARIIGILQTRQFLKNRINKNKRPLRSLLTKAYFISSERLIDDLLNDMSRIKVHMGIVVDSEHRVLGIVTVEDILEELVGEIWDESDEVLDYFMELGGNRYEVNGDLLVSRALDLIHHPYDKDKFKKLTMMEWAKAELPLKIEEDDEFEYDDLLIRISEMQNGIIKKMVIKVKEPDDE